jgi:Mrp family chromosome partitioning ATPase
VADILALKAQADGTLLVARAGETPREAIEESARNLGRDHILGIILNGVEGLNRTYSKYYGYGRYKAGAKPTKGKTIEDLGLEEHAS